MGERAVLALEDGKCFHGYRFGHSRDGDGEVVFTTSMTGYQEVCTDPSYHGQVVVFTYPLIGNCGINSLDVESKAAWVAGVVVREYCAEYSHWQAEGALHDYLCRHEVPGICGVDTRALTRHLRTHGTMRGIITSCPDDASIPEAVERARHVVPLSEKRLVDEASPKQPYSWPKPSSDAAKAHIRIAVLDCGTRNSIMRSLQARGAELIALPFDASSNEVLELRPDGILISDGPGDPTVIPDTVQCLKELLATRLPIMGICLGHQVLGQAIGGTVSRLKFGHHGGNHPVKDLTTGRVYITSQNHEFQVDAASIPEESGFFVSHVNLNDRSVEGLAHRQLPVFSVQYHPEGSPGPQDNQYVLDKFVALVSNKER